MNSRLIRHGSRAALVIGLCALTACSDNNNSPTGPTVITGSGNVVSETRTVTPVHSVDLRMAGTVNLIPGGTQALTVRADDNVLAHIATRDSSGILIVEVQAGSAIQGYTLAVDLTLPDLQGVVVSSAGTVAGSGFVVNAVSIVQAGSGTVNLNVVADAVSSVLAGPGSIILAGQADAHQIVLSGTGAVHAFGLATSSSSVVLSGSGPVECTASASLNVVLSGSGTVYYKGSPTVSSVVTGTGSVVDAN